MKHPKDMTPIEVRALCASLRTGFARQCGVGDGTRLVSDLIGEEITLNDCRDIANSWKHSVEFGENWDDAEVGRIVRERLMPRIFEGCDMDRAEADQAEADAESKLERAA